MTTGRLAMQFAKSVFCFYNLCVRVYANTTVNEMRAPRQSDKQISYVEILRSAEFNIVPASSTNTWIETSKSHEFHLRDRTGTRL